MSDEMRSLLTISGACHNSSLVLEASHFAVDALPASLSRDDRRHIQLAASFLKEQGAKRVWLFGSLAKGVYPQFIRTSICGRRIARRSILWKRGSFTSEIAKTSGSR
jgi:hypothetical protein